MRLDKCALLCAILVLSCLEPTIARRSFGRGSSSRHSYPSSGGLSGGGHSGSHGYPSSGGLSGSGSGHKYPPSGGLSGGGSGYPSSGGSHGYPSSGGSHGYPSSGGGLSGSGSSTQHHPGNHGYPAGKGLAGNTGSTTNIHHHYHYNPPQQISYTPAHGPPMSYPVYHGSPPNYVYQYKDSGSKYGTLLAGLALMNLGTIAAGTAYAVSHSHSNSNSNSGYQPQPGEYCIFGVKKDNGEYEETKIDCQLTSNMLLESVQSPNAAHNNTITTTTVTNVTTVNTTNADPAAAPVNGTTVVANPLYEMLPNGTLVPVNVTVNATNVAVNITSDATNNPASSVIVTTTTTNTTTVTNALDVKGKEIDVTPGMQCFVIKVTPTTKLRKVVPCGVLRAYAQQSLKKNSATRSVPAMTVLVAVCAAFVMY